MSEIKKMRFQYKIERIDILNLPKGNLQDMYQCEFYCQGLKVETEISPVNWSNNGIRFSKPMTIESNMLFGILEIHLNKLEKIEEEKK